MCIIPIHNQQEGEAMDIEANKALVRRYVELYNTGNIALADEVIASDFEDHTHPELRPGPEDVKHEVEAFRAAFPDAYATIEDIISEGDMVAFRFVLRGTHQGSFASLPATGKKVTMTGMDFIRIANGKLAELWSNQDTLGWLQQLGLELK
jgi:steroid delta-isomerase-like uncharacterized protein